MKERKKWQQIVEAYKRGGKKIDKQQGKENTWSFGAKRGPIDSAVMSLVLAGVHRDRSRAERGQGRGGGGLGCDSQQQTTPVRQASDPTRVRLKDPQHRTRLPETPTQNIVAKAVAEPFSLSARQRLKKESKQEKYKLNPDGERSQTQHHFSFLLQITKQWPPPLSQIHYTQAI